MVTWRYLHLVEVGVEGVEASGMKDLDVVPVSETGVDILGLGVAMNERDGASGRARHGNGHVRGLGEVERVVVLWEGVRVWRGCVVALYA